MFLWWTLTENTFLNRLMPSTKKPVGSGRCQVRRNPVKMGSSLGHSELRLFANVRLKHSGSQYWLVFVICKLMEWYFEIWKCERGLQKVFERFSVFKCCPFEKCHDRYPKRLPTWVTFLGTEYGISVSFPVLKNRY